MLSVIEKRFEKYRHYETLRNATKKKWHDPILWDKANNPEFFFGHNPLDQSLPRKRNFATSQRRRKTSRRKKQKRKR